VGGTNFAKFPTLSRALFCSELHSSFVTFCALYAWMMPGRTLWFALPVSWCEAQMMPEPAFVPFADTRLGQWLGTATPSIEGIWQWEGGVYLGAGVLFALLACLPFWRGALPALKRHAVFASALALMLIYAISNRIGLGSHELLHVPLPDVEYVYLLGFALSSAMSSFTLLTGIEGFTTSMLGCVAISVTASKSLIGS